MMTFYDNIVSRNRDVELIVNAAARMEKLTPSWMGKQMPKRFALLVTTDIHARWKQLQNAVEYLNAMDALDAGICLGDMQCNYFTDNDGSWYTMCLEQSKKPFYTTIGNHDCGLNCKKEYTGTKEQIFDKFIRKNRAYMNLPTLEKTYYSVNFDAYKITLLVLDNYMASEARDENGDFIISRSQNCFDQEEIDWLIKTLAEVPQDYHVVIAQHSYMGEAEKVACIWSHEDREIETEYGCYGACELLPDVINAWVKGTNLQKTYEPVENEDLLSALYVNADFTARGKGIFIAYLIGHYHMDTISKSKVYPDQNIIFFDATVLDRNQNFWSDLPRVAGTKSEDCITVMAVDTEKQRIHLVRIGSNYTVNCVERKVISIPY